MSNNKEKKVMWYESGNVITTIIILVILAAIFCSQSFAVVGDNSLSIISSVINHNSLYLVALIYFVLLKTRTGKRYFNYLNAFFVFMYFISLIAAFLTLIQSFSLNTILGFFQSMVIILYLFHTMFRDTRVWKEFHLGNSPFNELKNDTYYYSLLVLVAFNLAVNLISTVVISGLFISILDALYILLLGRYIYLYREYLDYHNLDVNNSGNFNELKESITSNLDDVKDKINDVLEKTEVDDKIVDAAEKVKETVEDKVKELKKKDTKEVEEKKPKKREKKEKGESK